MPSDEFQLGVRVGRDLQIDSYDREPDDPIHRTLQILALDLSYQSVEGARAEVRVPYEPLQVRAEEGLLVGSIFEIDAADETGRIREVINPDDTRVLLSRGVPPSPSDPRFHQQNVYSIAMLVYASFREALGRETGWGFVRDGSEAPQRLRLRPYGAAVANAWYDRKLGEVVFGWFPAPADIGGWTPEGVPVYTALSHDIVVHEVTHALLDGLRAGFMTPSGPDALAFHEGFSDLVALFHRFSHAAVLERGLGAAAEALNRGLASERGARGDAEGGLVEVALLHELARQFGEAVGLGGPLRSGFTDARYDVRPPDEPHERGRILVAAVFDAFSRVYVRRIRRVVRLATGGSGILPAGELSPDLIAVLAEQASKLARHFLRMIIRALDYCPPVDIHFGEFLRAVVTSDRDLVPHDPWGYREAWCEAFRRKGIVPPDVEHLSEDALLWRSTSKPFQAKQLAFSRARFDRVPGRPLNEDELFRQAIALGRFVTGKAVAAELGILPAGPLSDGGYAEMPVVESIRASRRVGPDGQVLFDFIGEILQTVWMDDGEGVLMPVPGGATVIIGPSGELRYAIKKRAGSAARAERMRELLRDSAAAGLWEAADGRWALSPDFFRVLSERRTGHGGHGHRDVPAATHAPGPEAGPGPRSTPTPGALQTPELSPEAGLLLDNLRAGLTRVEVDGEPLYVLEGDRLVDDDQLLWYVRERTTEERTRLAEPDSTSLRLVGGEMGGKPVRWIPGSTLRWCVRRDSFPSEDTYREVQANMLLATREWQSICCIRFEYRPELDSAASNLPNGVLFSVRWYPQVGQLIAAAFQPNETSRRRLLVFPAYWTSPYDRVGVLRHEVGHILGFRHEHIRSGAPPSCPDDESAWGAVPITGYDPKSVMHYFCGGQGSHELEITDIDRAGAIAWYGPPLDAFEEPA